MWSYYGSKGEMAKHYPPPKFDKIIEPFAGTAKYALRYWDREITLVDKYDVIIKIWHYLQQATLKDILGLPKLKYGDSLNNYNLSKNERNFLGFLIVNGLESPRINVGSFKGINVNRDLKKIALNLHKIRHWKIIHGSYEDLPNEKATWFIDPPYQHGGEHYRENNKKINFKELAKWCEVRKGQTIVCENTKATWMNFKPVKEMKGTHKITTEAIWSNLPTAFDNVQAKLAI